MAGSGPYYVTHTRIAREGNHFRISDMSGDAIVGEKILGYEAMLKLADQAVRAVTAVPSAEICPLPRQPAAIG